MKYVCLGYIEDKYFADLTPKQQQEFMDACFAYDEELQKGGHMIKGKRATRMLTESATMAQPVLPPNCCARWQASHTALSRGLRT